MTQAYNGPLHRMAMTTPTQYFNDSCSVDELNYALARGAVGATSNPVIVGNVLKKEVHLWRDRIQQLIRNNQNWSETEIGWKVYEELAVNGANMLLPVYERSGGRHGRLSIQTDPAAYNNAAAITRQALYFHTLAPNMQVKLPATSAGLSTVEELTYRGVNINVTVSFSVPQVIEIAERMERGLKRRDAERLDTTTMTPFATLMVGRNDDWMKLMAKRHALEIPAENLEWPGVACFKEAYRLFQKRGYRTQLLSAAYRNFYHWTEFVGGQVSLTIPHEWQVKFNESDVIPVARMHEPIADDIMTSLTTVPDFLRSFNEHGMTVPEFDSYGPVLRTLRTFIEAWHAFVATIRDFMLPNPD